MEHVTIQNTAELSNGENLSPVWFVNRFFFPDISATSLMLTDLAFGLAQRGVPIRVVTSRLRYDNNSATLASMEHINRVRIHRIATTRFGNAHLAGKLLDYLSFYVTVTLFLLRNGKRGDTLVVKTDPPLVCIPLWLVAKIKGMSLVHWCQDLFPEVAQAAGFSIGPKIFNRRLQKTLIFFRNAVLRRSAATVAIGLSMQEKLQDYCGRDTKIWRIPNWSDTNSIHPLEPTDNALRRAWGLDEHFVVAYSGNLGFAHPVDTVVAAAKLLEKNEDIVFLFIGAGVRLADLKHQVSSHGLAHKFCFQPYQPRTQLAQSLGAGDLHLIMLDPAMEGLLVPSKFYGIGAAGRPAVVVGALDGELASELSRRKCGVAVSADDASTLASVITNYASNSASRKRDGENARTAVLAENTIEHAVQDWLQLLVSVDSNYNKRV